ncbi:hypothetical protein PF003_g34672 [Phytophthora fragariae]|nr:hypothetical protein PF003_g34672 [Phytophthora fragariae]
MAKLPKLSKVTSLGVGSARVGPSELQNGAGNEIHRVNSRSVVVAAVINHRIVPAAPMVREADKENHRLIFTFREAFGILGVPILGTLVACIAWTTWLIYIALAPNQAANWLMGTSTYDNGQFWSIIDTTPVMTNIGAACLVLVDLCYLYVVVKMLRWRTTVARLYATSSRPHEDIRVDPTTDSWIRTASDRVKTNYHELTSFRGSKRKFWVRTCSVRF